MVAKKTAVRKTAARDAAPARTDAPEEAARQATSGGDPSPSPSLTKEEAGSAGEEPVAAGTSSSKRTTKTASTGSAGRQAGARGRVGAVSAAKETLSKAPPGEGAAAPAAEATVQRTASSKKVAKKRAVRTTGATMATPKKSTSQPMVAVPAARPAGVPAAPDELAVRPGEEPWTSAEAEEAHHVLAAEVRRLRVEIAASEKAISGLMRDSGDGSGDDQADTGSKNITREHELALADNAREMLRQTERALERLASGTYGLCESCGLPIGKARMQAFSRATLCVGCKQRQERH